MIGNIVQGDFITFLGGILAHRCYFPFEVAALDLVGALIWAFVLAGAGYVAGQAVQTFPGRLHLNYHLAWTLAPFLAGALVLWYVLHRRRGKGGT